MFHRRTFSKQQRQVLRDNQLERCNNSALAEVIDSNIDTIHRYRNEAEDARTVQDQIADYITHFSGSMAFVYFHVVWFGLWILLNVHVLGVTAFDPFPFGLLTTIVSLEAIFLSTFVLVSQNRQAVITERRAELDLQINLLSEYEVTRILQLADAIAKRLDVETCDQAELDELEKDVEPKAVLEKLEDKAESMQRNKRSKANPETSAKK